MRNFDLRVIETQISRINHPYYGKNTFSIEQKYHNGASSVAIYSLSELMDEERLRPLLLKILDSVPEMPKDLSVKEQIAILQLQV